MKTSLTNTLLIFTATLFCFAFSCKKKQSNNSSEPQTCLSTQDLSIFQDSEWQVSNIEYQFFNADDGQLFHSSSVNQNQCAGAPNNCQIFDLLQSIKFNDVNAHANEFDVQIKYNQIQDFVTQKVKFLDNECSLNLNKKKYQLIGKPVEYTMFKVFAKHLDPNYFAVFTITEVTNSGMKAYISLEHFQELNNNQIPEFNLTQPNDYKVFIYFELDRV